MAFSSIISFAERDELSNSLYFKISYSANISETDDIMVSYFIRFAGLYFDKEKCVIISMGFVIFLLVVLPYVACGSPCRSWTVIG